MLLQKIKDDSLVARKAKEAQRATILVTLYAEAARVGKDAGNRDSTDEEVLKVVRKFVKGLDESLAVIKDAQAIAAARFELEVLKAYLPKQLTLEELKEAVARTVAALPVANIKAFGSAMADLKAKHGATFDAAQASEMLKRALT